MSRGDNLIYGIMLLTVFGGAVLSAVIVFIMERRK